MHFRAIRQFFAEIMRIKVFNLIGIENEIRNLFLLIGFFTYAHIVCTPQRPKHEEVNFTR